MKGAIRVGIGGWNYPPWRGVFYPEGLPQKRELEFASTHVTSIEINATYYSAFNPDTFARWRDTVPEGFVFSLKGSRYSSNRRRLADAAESVERFVNQGIAELRTRLGPINWQFMATKQFDPEDFEAFLKLLPREAGGLRLRHALDVRHESFNCQRFFDLARRYDRAVVYAHSAKYPEIDVATADFTYARLMRTEENIESGYGPKDLDHWAERARNWAERGDVFVYFIAGAKLRAPAAAKALIERIRGGGTDATSTPARRAPKQRQ